MMKTSTDLVNELKLAKTLQLEEIPTIDLYMDQVIQLFDHTYEHSKRNADEKILTKTMINNYAKGKLLPPIVNKKYSRNHIILMNLIYELKGALTLADIKEVLKGFKDTDDDTDLLQIYYQSYLELLNANIEQFKESVTVHEKKVEQTLDKLNASDDLKASMQILTMIHMSNLYRKTAEKMLDEWATTKQTES